ncbi:hypothetical protein WA588_006364 [Blastocystis sp. NMH]
MELSTVIMEKTSFPHADNSNGSGVGGVSVSVFRESRENGMSSSASSVWESVLGSFSPSLSSGVSVIPSSSLPFSSASSLPSTAASSLPFASASSMPFTSASSIPFASNSSMPFTSNSSMPFASNSSMPFASNSSPLPSPSSLLSPSVPSLSPSLSSFPSLTPSSLVSSSLEPSSLSPTSSPTSLPTSSPSPSPSSSSSSPPRRLSLVITLSADIHANTPIPAKIENTLRFLSLYQTHFPFRAILFTRSKRLISRGKQLNLTVVRKVQKNAFGMPVLRAMLTEAKRLFAANHYGYINADILFSPALFPALSLVAAEPSIEKSYLIAGRVYDVHYSDLNLNFTSVESFDMSLKRLRKRHGLRNPNSADLFVFSREFPVTRMAEAVIGRRKIDSYVMFFSTIRRIPLIDCSAGVLAVHQGRDTYNDHSRARDNDYYYNSQFYSDAMQRLANLARASFRIVEGKKGVALVKVARK